MVHKFRDAKSAFFWLALIQFQTAYKMWKVDWFLSDGNFGVYLEVNSRKLMNFFKLLKSFENQTFFW